MTTTNLNLLNPLIMQDMDDEVDKDEKKSGLGLDEEEDEEEGKEGDKEGSEEDGEEKDYID